MASDAEKTDLQHPLIQDFAKVKLKSFFFTSLLSVLFAGGAAGCGILLDRAFDTSPAFLIGLLVSSFFILQWFLFLLSKKTAYRHLKTQK